MSTRYIEFEARLRNRIITVRAEVIPPDTSIGIMGWSLEGIELYNFLGEPLDWELTDKELDELYEIMPNPEDNTPDFP